MVSDITLTFQKKSLWGCTFTAKEAGILSDTSIFIKKLKKGTLRICVEKDVEHIWTFVKAISSMLNKNSNVYKEIIKCFSKGGEIDGIVVVTRHGKKIIKANKKSAAINILFEYAENLCKGIKF